MKYPYCLPIIKTQQAEVLSVIAQNRDDYAYFEVWLDYLETVDEAFILQLQAMLGPELVVLFRRQNLEPIHMDLAKRLAIIDQLQNTEVLIDLDISQTEELSHCLQAENKVNTIVSYHNYQETPGDVQLKEIIATMTKYNPAIYKLATLCNSYQDTLRLLNLLLELKQQDLRVIVLGMSEYGVATRIFGTLWGNEMIFAPQDIVGQSAPGQLTKGQLEHIFTEIEEST